ETAAPTVAVTAPAAGASVSGVTALSVNASDNVLVAGVQYLLSGAPVGTEVTSAPFSTSWDTRLVLNGSYTLSARVRDAAGNTATSAGVTVTVGNSADTPPPTVRFTNPTNTLIIGGTTLVLSAVASDN